MSSSIFLFIYLSIYFSLFIYHIFRFFFASNIRRRLNYLLSKIKLEKACKLILIEQQSI